MSRAVCSSCDCTREARYMADIRPDNLPGVAPVCARCAQTLAHKGFALLTVGTCGHPATVADMVARRPCPACAALIEDGDSPDKAAYWVERMAGNDNSD